VLAQQPAQHLGKALQQIHQVEHRGAIACCRLKASSCRVRVRRAAHLLQLFRADRTLG